MTKDTVARILALGTCAVKHKKDFVLKMEQAEDFLSPSFSLA